MVIVDTTVWIDYLRDSATPQTEWLDRQVERQRLGLTDVILCEVLQGVRDEARFRAVRAELLRFEVFGTGGTQLALTTALNYRALRARGRTLRTTIHGWIATFCLMHGHALLHSDRDLDPFEEILGLQVIHP